MILSIVKYKVFIVFIIYLFILLLISFFIKDISNQFEIYYSVNEIMKKSNLGDPISFLSGAINVAENGWFTPENQWLINLWPPGFMLLEGFIIKLFGKDVYIIIILQILASILFSIILTMLYRLLSENINQFIAFLIPLILFISPVSRVFLLEPNGILLGESFSIGFFLIFVLFSLRALEQRMIIHSITAGFFLGISAYFRSQFETILVIISLFGVLYIIFYVLKYNFFSKTKNTNLKIISILFYIILVSNMTTLPWRIYNYVNNDRISWIATTSLTYSNLVRTSESLMSVGGGWIVEGKGNMICLINPLSCDDIEKSNSKLLINTFLNNPILWYKIKFEPLDRYWFSELGYWTSPSVDNTIINICINYIIILMSFFILITLYLKRNLLNIKIISLIVMSMFFCYMMIFTVVHFEARYFYFPKIFIIFTFIICLNSYLKRVNDEK